MKHQKYEDFDIPRLDPEIKQLNGKSTRRLAESIASLDDFLKERARDENPTQERHNGPSDAANSE